MKIFSHSMCTVQEACSYFYVTTKPRPRETEMVLTGPQLSLLQFEKSQEFKKPKLMNIAEYELDFPSSIIFHSLLSVFQEKGYNDL